MLPRKARLSILEGSYIFFYTEISHLQEHIQRLFFLRKNKFKCQVPTIYWMALVILSHSQNKLRKYKSNK